MNKGGLSDNDYKSIITLCSSDIGPFLIVVWVWIHASVSL